MDEKPDPLDYKRKFEDILENAGEAIVVIQDGVPKLLNQRALELSGFEAGDVLSKNFIEFVHPEDRDLVVTHHLARLAGEEIPATYTVRMLDARQNVRWAELHSVLIQWEGRPATLNFFTEVTDKKRVEAALREQEKKYQDLVRDAPAAILEMDFMTGRILSVNDVACLYSGYGKEELLGRPVLELMTEDSQADLIERVLKVMEGKEVAMTHEYRVRKKDGTTLWVLANLNHTMKDGQPVLSRAVLTDITERRMAQECAAVGRDLAMALGSISSLAEAMEAILDAALRLEGVDCGGVYIVDPPTGRLELLAHRGLSHEFVEAVKHFEPDSPQARLVMAGEPIHHKGHDEIASVMNGVRQREGLTTLTVHPIRHEGRVVACLNLASKKSPGLTQPVKNALENLAAQLGAVIARVRAEEESRQSEEKYRALVENATDAIFILQDGGVRFPNPTAESLLGYPAKELKTMDFVALIHPDDRASAMERHLKRYGHKGKPQAYPCRMLHKNGSTVLVSAAGVAIHWEGRPAVLMFATDITETRRLSDELEKAQRMKAIAALAGGVAHDFNNLLMAIQGNASLAMMETELGHPARPRLKNIEECVLSGSKLTAQLLGYAKGGKYHVEPCDLNAVVRDSSAMFGRARKEINIQLRLCPELHVVEADRGQIEQVLLNMYVNAWHAMGQGGDLVLETENVLADESSAPMLSLTPGKYARISVTDTGVGMDEETQKRIFEPFFTTRKVGTGVGLGLASAWGIVKNHGGSIRVYSEPGRGSNFHVHLPASDKVLVPNRDPAGQLILGEGLVLVVDDEPAVLDAASGMLKELGYSVLAARGGDEAVAAFKAEKDRIRLVLLDLVMPGVSGAETFKELRRLSPGVGVLLSSGYSQAGQAQDLLDLGASGFIQKPFTLAELSGKLHKILKENACNDGTTPK